MCLSSRTQKSKFESCRQYATRTSTINQNHEAILIPRKEPYQSPKPTKQHSCMTSDTDTDNINCKGWSPNSLCGKKEI